MLYLYGLIDPRPLPGRLGLEERRLRRLDAGCISAVTSEVAEPPAPTEEALWTHEAVLEALLVGGPVLPLRFGVAYADEDQLLRELDERGRELAAALERVRGKVEIAVRVLDTSGDERALPAVAEAGPGTRFLLERLQRRRDAADRAQPIQERLTALASAERAHLLPQPDTILSAAYLVDAGAVAAFQRAAARLERSHDDIAVLCTGPWPPYNFAEAAPAAR